MATAIVLQTQDNASPGLLGVWAERRGIELDVLRVDRWEQLPGPEAYAFAVVLGSDASVVGTPDGWVARLIGWVARADESGLPVLGISFGAQVLAAALGGGAVRLMRPEHAWIELDVPDSSPVPPGPWLALHEDVVQLPRAAHELARNGAVSRKLLVDAGERCSVGAVGALELFDGFAGRSAPRAASVGVA